MVGGGGGYLEGGRHMLRAGTALSYPYPKERGGI